ncbi:MAG: hypothetical protein IAE93_12905 [Ignavibacteria bacterium]|nr:hypothetical protein [Ignavibacteria bacterium]
MITNLDNKTRLNGWLKFVIASFITLFLSIGGALLTSAKISGVQENKIEQTEKDLKDLKSDYSSDHNLIIRIDEKVTNIEKMLKEVREEQKTFNSK